jgi:hypothetical protein
VPGINWTKLLKDLIEGIAFTAKHGDVCLIILQCKQFLPWGLLQWDQCASRNLTIALTSLINREGSKKVLPIAGMLKFCPLLLCKTMGKAKKEEVMQELHCNNGGMEDAAMWV